VKMQTVPLSELGEIVSGSTPKTGVPEYWDGDIPWVTPADLSKHEGVYFHGTLKKISKAGFDSCSTAMLPAGSILFSSRAPIGHCAVTTYPACTNQGFKSIVPNQQLDPVYGFFALKFLTPAIVAMGRGATFSEINKEIFESVQIPYCDLREQRRIAAQLEQADRLVRTRRYALELTDAFLPAAFLELFGDPVKNAGGSNVEPLEDLIQPTRPITYGILMPGPDVRTGVPYIRVTDIQEGQVVTGLVRRTTPEINQAYKRSMLKPGDLLLSIRGHVGRMAIVPSCLNGANITQDTARLATVDTIESRYLMGCLASPGMQHRMAGLTRGAAVQGINLTDVKELPIPVPPLRLQRRFAAAVERAERLREVQREALRQAEHLFASLLDHAFSG
jgi:type I restriction enzyme S subunit